MNPTGRSDSAKGLHRLVIGTRFMQLTRPTACDTIARARKALETRFTGGER